jgi:Protein of unknown function (DUF4239)
LSAIAIGLVVFALVYASALLAMFVHSKLPDDHLTSDSKDVVKLGVALVATMSTLVLSLLISSAKTAFDTRSNQLVQAAADIVLLDRALARYGPETKEARSLLRQDVAETVERFWPDNGAKRITLDNGMSPAEAMYDRVDELAPQNEAQRSLRNQALSLAVSVGQLRLLMLEHMGSSIPLPFLVILVFWLCIIFASFGLFAPRNATVVAVLGVCALSVACAIFLIIELDRSFEGLLQVSGAPMRTALAQLGR